MAPYRSIGQRGFSTIEILIGASLGLLVMAASIHHSVSQQHVLRQQSHRVNLQSMGRGILELFAREVRMAGLDPKCVGTFEGIAQATATRVELRADLDGSGTIGGDSENLLYEFDAADENLSRSEGGSTDELIDGVEIGQSRIRYFDGDGVELVPDPELDQGERATVRRVRIELALRAGVSSQAGDDTSPVRLSSDVNLRSRFLLKNIGCS